jgi:hypothetical protein
MTRFPRPVPRLSTAVQRLGVSAATAAALIGMRRFPENGDPSVAESVLSAAFLQRHTRLAVHPWAPRDPSEYRKGFGRFPQAPRTVAESYQPLADV